MQTEIQLTRTERILKPFGAHHGAELIRFFNRIANYECDFVIFMARKSLCLYRMMQLCGAKPISVPVYSDAILEGDGKLLSGKKILIVDDTLFVGTTLSDATARLKTLDVAEVQVWVFAADVETWSKKTFSPDYIHIELSEQAAIEFCGAECRSLINAGIPYLTDFASSQRIRISAPQLERMLRSVNWAFHDVSSQYHNNSKVKYYSCLPDQHIHDVVRTIVGDSIFNLIEIAKIRVFSTWSGRSYDTTFVPLVTFAPCSEESLKSACISIAGSFGLPKEFVDLRNSADRMRLLQFLVGAVYMKPMWTHIESIVEIGLSKKLDYDWCQAGFDPELAESLASGISQFYSNNNSKYIYKDELPALATEEPKRVVEETRNDIDSFLDSTFSKCDDIEFGHSPLSDLTAIMLKFQDHFESKARAEVVNGEPDPKYRNRLKRGMAWGALSKHLLERYGSEYTRHHRNVLSLFLDRLVDFGVAVPIISTIDGLIYRAYRHGEDVKFGAQEESLVYYLLEGFQAGRGVEKFEATYFEKLIVILLRVGMNEEWLNLWYSTSVKDELVRIGYHLQGAVPISPGRDDELVPEGETSWLTRRLCKTGTITVEKDASGRVVYGLGERPSAAHARSDAQRTALQLGHALGKVCVYGGQKRSLERPLGTRDLIVLTSCSNPIDSTSAVSAELQIFVDWFLNSGIRVLTGDFNMPGRPILQRNFAKEHGSQAFNSASWKIKMFREHEIDNVKLKVYQTANGDPEFIARRDIWNAVFAAFDRKAEERELAKIETFLSSAAKILVGCEFLFNAVVLVAKIAQVPETIEVRRELNSLVVSADLTDRVHFRELRDFSTKLAEEMPKEFVLDNLQQVASQVAKFGRMLCIDAKEEATTGQTLALEPGTRLGRKEYRYLVWYDVLNSRIRGLENPDEVVRYEQATNVFRDQISSFLNEFVDAVQANGGDVFVQQGDITSQNDEKHVFLSGKGAQAEEANRLVTDIKRIAQRCGVRLRLLAIPTNLRGDFVYLNRGQADIGGDFLRHAHTLIDNLSHHEIEGRLKEGESVVWVHEKHARFFHTLDKRVRVWRDNGVDPLTIDVEIRKMISTDTLLAFT